MKVIFAVGKHCLQNWIFLLDYSGEHGMSLFEIRNLIFYRGSRYWGNTQLRGNNTVGGAVHEVVKYLKAARGWVLDIGCGDGQVTVRAAQRLDYAYFIGLDSSLTQLSKASTLGRKVDYIRWIAADLNKGLPFKDESINVIYSYSVLQYFSHHQYRILTSEIASVLRPGGKCFHFGVPDGDSILRIRIIGQIKMRRLKGVISLLIKWLFNIYSWRSGGVWHRFNRLKMLTPTSLTIKKVCTGKHRDSMHLIYEKIRFNL